MNIAVPNRPLNPVVVALTGGALMAAAFWMIWTLLLWYRLHPHLPWRDLFVILDNILPLLRGETSWTEWQILTEPHYASHRIAIPRLLVALDLRFFHGQSHVLYTGAWLGIVACLGITMGMARGYFRQDRMSWYFCLGIVGILFFAPAHLWNLINAINASWHISFACAFISFFILLRGPGTPGPTAWALAYGFATIAAFTTFVGVIVWLLLPTLALNGSRRTLAVIAGLSLLLTLGYLDGISSDAEIASAWDSQNVAVNNEMHEIGLEAMAANTPLIIIHKAMKFLAWPMSSTQPTAALVLVGLSFMIIAYFWLGFLYPQKLTRSELHPWLKLSLLIATLGLGIALATQLGRIIEQANHANGPSFERYNTVVAVYWSGIFGLLLSLLNRLPDRPKIGLMAISLAVVTLLIVPGGHYLKQEILSVEYAAKLYAGGETPALRSKVGKKMLHFKPEYVYSFDAFFDKYELAYYAPEEVANHLDKPPECDIEKIGATLSKSRKKGFKKIEGQLVGPLALMSRDVLIYKDDQLAARLTPRHGGDYSPLALLNPAYNSWLGHIASTVSRNKQLQVLVNALGPASFRCRIGRIGGSASPSSRHNSPEAPQDV